MWLNQLFGETSIDFEKRCKNRIAVGGLFAVLGAVALLLVIVLERTPVMYMQPGYRDVVPGFYIGIGSGFLAAGVVRIVRNVRYLKNPDLSEKRKIYETDERNRLLGLRCWAYAGYSMFLFLYMGVIISGFISLTAMKVLMAVAGIYGLMLLIFRRVLQKYM